MISFCSTSKSFSTPSKSNETWSNSFSSENSLFWCRLISFLLNRYFFWIDWFYFLLSWYRFHIDWFHFRRNGFHLFLSCFCLLMNHFVPLLSRIRLPKQHNGNPVLQEPVERWLEINAPNIPIGYALFSRSWPNNNLNAKNISFRTERNFVTTGSSLPVLFKHWLQGIPAKRSMGNPSYIFECHSWSKYF